MGSDGSTSTIATAVTSAWATCANCCTQPSGICRRRQQVQPASKAKQPKKPAAAPVARNVVARWSRTLPLMARAMVLSDRILFVAGPPDVLTYVDDREVHPYRIHSEDAVHEQQAAFEGRRGGLLLAVSADDGSQLAEYRLDAMPAWDGMAAAGGRLYLSTHAGQVLCFAAE
jgi:molybdopterin-biosynthesis enzyme MoeA-like protein